MEKLFEIKIGLDGKLYAVFANVYDADHSKDFQGYPVACFGAHDNAFCLGEIPKRD